MLWSGCVASSVHFLSSPLSLALLLYLPAPRFICFSPAPGSFCRRSCPPRVLRHLFLTSALSTRSSCHPPTAGPASCPMWLRRSSTSHSSPAPPRPLLPSHCRQLLPSLTSSLPHLPTRPVAHSLTHSLARPLPHSLSLPQSLTLPTCSLTNSLARSVTYSLSLTHSLTP